MKIVSIILARGGSKGIPDKNIISLNHKPLIYYTIQASKQSQVSETWVSTEDSEIKTSSIFTDQGAKKYGEVAKRLFELHLKKRGISIDAGIKELATYLQRLPHSSPELVFQILLGNHDLTGLEMTNAYRNGSCGMRTALVEWCNDSLEDLNEAFLNAVITKSLK